MTDYDRRNRSKSIIIDAMNMMLGELHYGCYSS